MKRKIVFSILFLIPVMLFAAFWTTRTAVSAPADQEITGVGAAWYHPDWHYRRPITVTNTTAAQTNYAVRITLNSQFDFIHAQSTGADLRVTASDGTTDLAFWIERWDNVGLSATIWARVPSLAAGTTILYLYYGNDSAPAGSNGRMTFTAFEDFESFAVGSPPTSYSNLTGGEWARYAGNPVLQGTAGQWDASGATYASVIYDSDATRPFRMYYHGLGTTSPCTIACIGLATSLDGQIWEKYGTSYIMAPGGTGAWDANGVEVPMVWKEGPSDYRMIYTGNGAVGLQVGYATSTDGVNWTKYASNPVFNDPNAWAHDSTMNWGVIKVGSNYLMWYGDMLGAREASIATSTDLINWTPYASTPIFTSSGTPADDRYSQFNLFTFQYQGYYYVLVPSYSSVGNYARYYLYRSSSPYFPVTDRVLVRVVHQVGPVLAWDALDSATPAVFTLDIQRSQFYNNQLWLYYAGANAGGTWREGLRIEPNITTGLYGAPAGPWGSLTVTNVGSVTVAGSPVIRGAQSVWFHDTTSLATSYRGAFSAITQGVVSTWLYRTVADTLPTTSEDVDLYVYNGSGTLSALVGLGGRNGNFHYWNGTAGTPPGGYGSGFHDTGVTWNINTWYLVVITFDTVTVPKQYNFVIYDQNYNVVVSGNNISLGNNPSSVASAMLYTGSTYVGEGYGDDFLARRIVLPEPTVAVRSYSDIQERVQVTGAGPLTFGYTGIGMDVTTQGSLSYIQVIRYNYPHPSAPPAQQQVVKRYWEIIPNWNASGYTASLTLPHPYVPDDGDWVCSYISGTSWDCVPSSVNPATGTITRTGITQFSEWRTNEDFSPLAITLKNFSAASNTGLLIPGLLAASLFSILAGVGLLWRYRARTQH